MKILSHLLIIIGKIIEFIVFCVISFMLSLLFLPIMGISCEKRSLIPMLIYFIIAMFLIYGAPQIVKLFQVHILGSPREDAAKHMEQNQTRVAWSFGSVGLSSQLIAVLLVFSAASVGADSDRAGLIIGTLWGIGVFGGLLSVFFSKD